MKFLILLLFLAVSAVHGSRILCFFQYPSISHQYVLREIGKQLSLRGHEVTMVTPNPIKDSKLVNLTEIDVSESYVIFKKNDVTNINSEVYGVFSMFLSVRDVTDAAVKIALENKGVKELLQRRNDTFDLIIVEAHNPIPCALQHKFKAPLIIVSSSAALNVDQNHFGNPTHPVLYPHVMYNLGKPVITLWEKLGSLYFTVMEHLIYEYVVYPSSDLIARKHFGEDMPYITELIKNTSMLLLNINPIFSLRRPTVPNVIEYFNLHDMNRREEIREDVKKILDNAKEGVVYFSLGTNVRFEHVEGDVKRNILEALGDLPYTVLCKWESESVPNQPKNVHLRKWLPQQAVLGHPNIKVFVTQGGLHSSEEAIVKKVPLVMIPFLGDQPMNARILTAKGMAETILPRDVTKERLTKTILKVAKDEKYRNKVEELRSIFVDQPQSGIDKVIWWCEYVIRHKGARHLRSPGADIPLWEYFMLDVLAVILGSLYVAYKIISLVLSTLLGLLIRPAAAKSSKKRN